MVRRPPLRSDRGADEAADGDDERVGRLTTFTDAGVGSSPIPLIPWTLLVARRRMARRAQRHDRFATIAMTVVLVAMFMVNLTVTAVTVAVPRIADDFGAAQSTVVWAVTGPLLVSAVLGPSFGKAGDQYGHRVVFLGGLVVNAIFTILIAASWGAGSFVTFRILAAIGSAAIGPSALAFINRLFDSRDRTSALGWWSFVGAGSPVIGVVAGGFVIEAVGWRWVFIVQAPLVVIAIVLAAVILPETDRRPSARFDVAGAVTLAIGVGSLLLAVTFAGTNGFSAAVFALFALATAALVVFIVVEGRIDEPLIPAHYWTMRGFVVPTAVLALLFAAYMGSFVLAPLMLQSSAFGYTAAATSWVIISRPLMFSITGPITGRLAPRLGERPLAAFGGLCVVASMFMLSRYEPSQTLIPMSIALGLAGVGMGSAAPVLTATVANSVADEDLGVAGAAQQMLQQVGLVVGIQALQALQTSLQGGEAASVDSVVSSYHTTFIVATVVAGLGCVMTIFLRTTTRDESVTPRW